MAKKLEESELQNLPVCAAEFIKLVIKKMRYRKKVRLDVQAELTAHFEDELRDCKTDEEKERRAQKLIEEFGDAKLLGTLLRRAKKRCRPLWRTVVARTLQTVGVLILCFIFYCVYISLGKPTIKVNYVEEAVRLVRPVADESLNAAPIYQKSFDAYKEPLLSKDKGGAGRKFLDAVKGKDWITELTEAELASLRQWFSDNTDSVEFYKQAVEKPYCWWEREAEDNFMWNLVIPEIKHIRNLTRMMVWQAKLKAYEGQTREAFDDLLVCYRSGRHFKGPRTLVEQLVGMGIQGLSMKSILVILDKREANGQLLKYLQAGLEVLRSEDTYTVSYEVERFLVLDCIQRCYTDNGRGSGHMIPSRVQKFMRMMWGDFGEEPFETVFSSLAISLASANRRDISREFDKLYDAAKGWAYKTPLQLREENVDFEMGINEWSILKRVRYRPIVMLMPALEALNERTYRHKTQINALITTIAVMRFKQSTGEYPESLDDLAAAEYLKSLPMDPWSDKPLIYKRTKDNFILYSVGCNFEDDDGQVYRDEEGKVKLWGNEFGDAVFWPVQK